ncbi:MAG: PLDc protein [Cohnella sp.]|jgi:hypothetical protein|nr:PLDc protein [Cohnella sp.]
MDKALLIKALLPLAAVNLILLITALVSLSRVEAVRGGKKWVWVLIVVLVNTIGPILYFTVGKKEHD